MPTEAPGARTANESTQTEAAQNVQAMFNSIAPRYDTLNHLISMGLDRVWWNRTASTFAPTLRNPAARILDLCCGTGDQTAALLALRPTSHLSSRPKQPQVAQRRDPQSAPAPAEQAHVEPLIGLDFSPQMLARAREKFPTANITWLEGDAMHLPFADNTFDLVTSAFGFRNLTDYAAGLREIARVLKPGGHIGILEANQPSGLRALAYNAWFHRVVPLIGGILSGDRAAYAYLPASVARFPQPPRMLELLHQAGFTQPAWTPYLLHSAGLYTATKA